MSFREKLNKLTPIFLSFILPFLMYAIYNSLQNLSVFSFYLFLSFFYFLLLISTMNIIVNFVDEIHLINKNKPKYFLIIEILKFVFLISFLFSTYYWIIQDYNNQNFINVFKGDKFEIFLDFFFFSVTSFIMNNSSEIKPNTLLSKGLVLTQIVFSFTTIVLFLAQHKEYGNFFKQINDKINKK